MPMYALTKVLYNVPKITSGNIILYHYLVDHKVILKKVSCMLSIVVGKWDEAMHIMLEMKTLGVLETCKDYYTFS